MTSPLSVPMWYIAFLIATAALVWSLLDACSSASSINQDITTLVCTFSVGKRPNKSEVSVLELPITRVPLMISRTVYFAQRFD